MRAFIFGLVAFCFAGVAHANPYDTPEYHSSDYSGLAYYQLDFGPSQGVAVDHRFGFRLASDRALQQGAPALFRLELTPSGQLSSFAVSGLELRGVALANGQTGPADIFSNPLTWAALGGAAIIIGAVVLEDDSSKGGSPSGTGTGSGGG